MERDRLANGSSYKIVVLGTLLALCALVMYYFHFVLAAEIVFTHLFYIPIILAGLWWSRKGTLVAVFLAVLLLISHVFSPLETPTGADIARATMFVVVGATVCTLNEKRLILEAKLRAYSKTLEQRVEERTSALREAQEKQRAILDGIGDAVIVLDQNLNVTWANPIAVEQCGFVLGHKCYAACKWQKQPCVDCVVQATFADGVSRTSENECTLRDGRRINFVANCSPVRDSEGKRVAVVEIFHDITARVQAETARRESEERYRTMIENANDLIWVLDTQGNFTVSNHQVKIVSGHKSKDWKGKSFVPLIHPDDLEMVNEVLQKTLSGTRQQYITRVYKKNGEILILSVNTAPIYKQGKIDGTVSFGRDITTRRQAQEALQESEEQLQTLIDAMPDFVCFKDGDGHWLKINAASIRLFRLAGVDYRGKKDSELAKLNGGLHGTFLTCARTDAETWRTRRLSRGEELITQTDGTIRIYDVIKMPVFHPDGERKGLVVLGHDVTERVQAEEERARLLAQIRAQAKQMQQTINTVPEGVLVLDRAQRVILANPVAEVYLAVLAGAQMGDTLTHLGTHPLAELLTSPPDKGLWHEGQADDRTFEVIARPMEPALKPVVSLSNHLPNEPALSLPNGNVPEPENWVLVIRDVTQEREIQQLIQHQERLATVGQLAAGIAHDFNNIMTVIVLYTQMGLRLPDLSPKLRKHLEIISQQANQATHLIRQLLDFSRRAVLERLPLDMTQFLKEQVKILECTLPENIQMDQIYGTDECTVHADPTRAQQVFLNLVLNARDAMLPQGGGKLHIALSRTAATDKIKCAVCNRVLEGEWVRIAVTDTGAGIAPEALPHIFEPFFTTKEVGLGTGLGLAQVAGIVEQHGGHMVVTTKIEVGTTFAVYLPVLLESQPEAPVLEREVIVIAQGQGEVLLLVENNAALREALADSLELLNYRVLKATNGREALVIIEQHADEIVLVLTDAVMPKMGGQTLFQELRKRRPTLPVVILSGHPIDNELEKLKAQGLAGWLPKPPTMGQLAELLAQVLQEGSE